VGDPEEKVSDEEHRVPVTVEKEALSLPHSPLMNT